MPWTSRVERTISAGHRAGPPGHRCQTQHGHDFDLVVEMTYKRIDPKTGWGPDFGKIKAIIDRYDHQNLNDEVPFDGGRETRSDDLPASSENLAYVLYYAIEDACGMKPDFVQVFEGHGNGVTYRE